MAKRMGAGVSLLKFEQQNRSAIRKLCKQVGKSQPLFSSIIIILPSHCIKSIRAYKSHVTVPVTQ